MGTPVGHVTLTGMDNLVKNFREIANSPNTRKYETQLMIPARKLAGQIKAKAPDGPPKSDNPNKTPKPNATIKNSVAAKKFKRRRTDHPAVMVAIDYRVAPHAYLVEYGTVGVRRPKEKEYMWFRRYSDGQLIRKKVVAPMPAQPFFRPTFDANKGVILRDMIDLTEKFIQQVASGRVQP